MRKLGYQTVNGNKGITVFTLEAKRLLEKTGLQMHEVLIDIPDERFHPMVAYKAVNGKLIRQTV